jgi:hypothetical protein
MKIKSNQRCGVTIPYAGGASQACDLPFGHSEHHRAGSNPAIRQALPEIETQTTQEKKVAQKKHELRSQRK